MYIYIYIRAICSDLNKAEPAQPSILSVVVDGTRDVTGKDRKVFV